MERLCDNLDNWSVENECIRSLEPYAAYIPPELIDKYVSAIVHTYVGHVGYSPQYNRTDFYANIAALRIPKMVEAFDDTSASAFVECIRTSKMLRRRMQTPVKLSRLRALANIVLEKVSSSFSDRSFLESLVDETREEEFLKQLTS